MRLMQNAAPMPASIPNIIANQATVDIDTGRLVEAHEIGGVGKLREVQASHLASRANTAKNTFNRSNQASCKKQSAARDLGLVAIAGH